MTKDGVPEKFELGMRRAVSPWTCPPPPAVECYAEFEISEKKYREYLIFQLSKKIMIYIFYYIVI